ncbi:MAG: hypothetical protein HN559_12200, partial [Gemmatimonadetes bacterium]|nr:hypothetical protein [Gemmatimonadota bacterium]
LSRLVEQYEAFSKKDPLRQSPWRQCEFGLRLVIPTLLHRCPDAVRPSAGTEPPARFDLVGEDWDLGMELPVPTWLFAPLSTPLLRQVVADQGEDATRALSDLQQAYYRTNLRFVDANPADYPHEFVAAMVELPDRLRGRVVLLLLHVYEQEEIKKELLAVAGSRRTRQRDLPRRITQIDGHLQGIEIQLHMLERIHGLRLTNQADLLLALRYLRGTLTSLGDSDSRHAPPASLPKRAFEFTRTQRRALLSLKRLLKSTGESDWHIVTSMIQWLGMLGPWRTDVNKPDLESVAKSLSHNLDRWMADGG